MFLNYFALAILLMGLVVVFYTFIYIHDIPHEIAKHRNHPQAEAIHVAGWFEPLHAARHLALRLHLGFFRARSLKGGRR